MLNIKPGDRVLEVGSGNRPRKRSDVLCDKYMESNYERSGGDNIVIDQRPFVAADALSLPFKDKSFDYVIASHILEHVSDPIKLAEELSRVAKAGYIETPSELGEHIFGWPFHKWRVHLVADTIVLRPRTDDSPVGSYFHRAYAEDPFFAEFVDSHLDHFYVRYEWTDRIKLKVDMEAVPSVIFNDAARDLLGTSSARRGLAGLMRSLVKLHLRFLRRLHKFDS